jgi:hypothetical protein
MKLILALYGGMECGRLFYDTYVQWHLDHGFTMSHYDKCFLYKMEPNGDFIKLVFHVDDAMIARKGKTLWKWYQVEFKKRFAYELSPLQKFLGIRIRICYKRRMASLDQQAQILKMLSEFGMATCSSVRTLFPQGSVPSKVDVPTDEKELIEAMASFDMRAACGHLNYINCCSRPDISLPLKILSRFMSAYGPAHIALAKHVMRFLKTTQTLPLILRGGYELGMQVFTDATHAGDPDTRRSITSIVIKVNGNTVFWTCQYQQIVSHSSCESELMALDKGCTVGQFVKWMVGIMLKPLSGPVDIFVDNKSTIDIGTNPVQPGRDRHVHARYFYVRDLVAAGEYCVFHLPSTKQVADILCSYKGMPNFQTLIAYLMGCARVEIVISETPASTNRARGFRERTESMEWNTSLLQ